MLTHKTEACSVIMAIGPLLDYGLKGGTLKALKGLPLFLRSCLYVCLSTSYRSHHLNQEPNVHDLSKCNDLGARNWKRKSGFCLISASTDYTLPLSIACTQVVAFAWIVHKCFLNKKDYNPRRFFLFFKILIFESFKAFLVFFGYFLYVAKLQVTMYNPGTIFFKHDLCD